MFIHNWKVALLSICGLLACAAVSQQVRRPKDTWGRINIVNHWLARVVQIKCRVTLPGTEVRQYSAGSATLVKTKSGIYAMTNRHVVEHFVVVRADQCRMTYRGTDFVAGSDQIVLFDNPSIDIAFVRILESVALESLFKRGNGFCKYMPEQGDPVYLFGHPFAVKDTLVTEGIVAGYHEDDILVTATMDMGSSGGAAVDARHGCYFGAPNAVIKGKAAAFGNVIPITSIPVGKP